MCSKCSQERVAMKYKIGEFSELTGIPLKTLQRWDREKKLVALRTLTNRRYYTYEQYLQLANKNR